MIELIEKKRKAEDGRNSIVKSLTTSEKARDRVVEAVGANELIILQFQEDMQSVTQENAHMQKGWHDRNKACNRLSLELYKLREQMNELEETNEILKRYNKNSTKLDEQLKAERRHKDQTGLGFTNEVTNENGEPSRAKAIKKDKKKPLAQKGKNIFNASCKHCGKSDHKTNNCRNAPIRTDNSHCKNCCKNGHKTSECWPSPISMSCSSKGSFRGYCYACNKFGHKAKE